MAEANVIEEEEVTLLEIQHGDRKIGLTGVSESGVVYLSGDLHVNGCLAALMAAAKAQVPYVARPSGEVLFPIGWLRSECKHDADRQRVFENLENFVQCCAV